MSDWKCPYCWKPLPDAHTACCQEIGHAVTQEPEQFFDDDEEEFDGKNYCDCGAVPDEEEESFRCKCCGKLVSGEL